MCKVILILITLLLAGCQQKTSIDQEGIGNVEISNQVNAYGIVYNDYIGIVNMTIEKGIITYITFDEAFMPITWARETEPGVLKDIVRYDNGKALTYNNEFAYAKYIVIDDILFTATPYEDTPEEYFNKQLIKYTSAEIPDLYTYLTEEENAAWYVNSLKSGKAYLADQNGAPLELTEYNPYGSFFKSSSLYWVDGPSGWARNMQLFANALIGTDLRVEPTMKDDYIVFGDIVTAATLKGYLDYYQLAKKAYERVK